MCQFCSVLLKRHSSSVRLDRMCMNSIFSNISRFSVWFRSSHSNTPMSFYPIHSTVAIEVYSEVFSFCRLNLCPSLWSFTVSNKFSFRSIIIWPITLSLQKQNNTIPWCCTHHVHWCVLSDLSCLPPHMLYWKKVKKSQIIFSNVTRNHIYCSKHSLIVVLFQKQLHRNLLSCVQWSKHTISDF